jgi:aspartyl-tRNA(Asn)/glutamyl-tRNA(Gln) amidotransferase subunit A
MRGASTGPLHGVPIAIKDNMCTVGVPTTASSKILAGFIPPYNATIVERLEQAGAIIVGKTNLDEFAMGSSTENSALGPSKNPWDVTRTPGRIERRIRGGGCGAPRAAGVWIGHRWIDSAAAGLCGIVGFKPTYGRVSRYGLLAFASSLDQIGPFATTVEDAALAFSVIGGFDSHDSTSAPEAMPDLAAALERRREGLAHRRAARLPWRGRGRCDPQGVRVGARDVGGRGATLVDIDLPHAPYGIPVYYLICTAEASSNLARYDGVRYGLRAKLDKDDGLLTMYERTRDQGFGPEVKRRIMLGTYVLSAGYYDAYYLKAQQVRTLLLQDYQRAFERVDVVATPTTRRRHSSSARRPAIRCRCT